jgi:hypothetical protein
LPVSVLSLIVLVVNDHFLKDRYHNAVTGKLSDAAGMVFFPLFIAAAIEVGVSLATRRRWRFSPVGVTVSVVASGAAFTLTKLWSPAADAYRILTAATEWPFFAVKSLITGSAIPGVAGTHLVHDLGDLVVLPILLIPWWFGTRARRATG